MEIVFNASTYEQSRKLEEMDVEYYEQVIFTIYNYLKDILDLSLLNMIVVPEDYKSEIFQFQRNNGHPEYITENKYGQGFAQVVSSRYSNGVINYNVFLDKKIVFALLDDNILLTCKDNLNDEDYRIMYDTRQLTINTLCHEFAHVHEYALNRNMEWLHDDLGAALYSQYIALAKKCWSEYFACRTASSSFFLQSDYCTEIISTCNDVEKMLQKKRSEYNRRIITLDEFVGEFHYYTTFLLKKIASAHGNLYCLPESREEIIRVMEGAFSESYVKAIWTEYGQALNKLYEEYPFWKNISVFDDLISLNIKYFNQFDIYISETTEGVYYEIPVRL